MLFNDIATEKDLEKLKRTVLLDPELYSKIETIRKETTHTDDKITVWQKLLQHTQSGTRKTPTNAEMLALYRDMVAKGEQEKNSDVEQVLRKIKVRSNSGVAVVSLLTKHYDCPGNCIYCPTEDNMPKSYLSKEPAAARALANDFDPYLQITNRLRALVANGHPVDKLEVIVIGGTWSFYHHKYQEEFMQEVFRAANNFGREEADKIKKGSMTLVELQRVNETNGGGRVIGLSIETRPDHINPRELNRLRWLGVTKIEIGVQHLDNDILVYNKRDMTAEEIAVATEMMRNAGFKVVYHMMPNLPKSNPEKDVQMFTDLFNSTDHQPDMLKIYPCVVLEHSELYDIWEDGGYEAYDDETLVKILIAVKKKIPKYVRIIRVIRDVPATYIKAGSTVSNLRQVLMKDMEEHNWQCKCIRCREVRNEKVTLGEYELQRIEYKTTTGREIFLSFEHKDEKENKCAAFLRLRLPNVGGESSLFGEDNLSVLEGAALVRELHTYGQLTKIDEKGGQSQHRGFGTRLMEEAARIAKEEGYKKVAVIAGVGVREYYKKKLGYHLDRTYMVKDI